MTLQLKIKNNIPELRFPGFSDEWKEKKLGEVCDVRDGTHDSPKYHKDGYPLITSKNLKTDGSINFEDINLITSKDFNQINKRSKVDRGDVLFGMIGTIGNPVIVKDDNFAIKNVALIKEQKELKNKYLWQYLKSEFIKKQFHQKNAGGTQKFIALGVIRNLEIPIPSSLEQQKIAGFLGSVDGWIENLKEQKEKLELYKKGIMQKIFSQEIRFPGFSDEWQEKKLGEICEYKNGESFEKSVVDVGKYNLITLNSININGNLKRNHKKVNKASWYLKENDLIMVLSDVAHGNFLGLVDIIPEDNKYVLNQRMGLLRKIDDQINLSFLRTYINKNQRYFKRHGQGSSQQNLSKGDILKFGITAPSIQEQKKIADFLTSVDEMIELKQQQITQAQTWKKGLMQKMFV